MAPGNCPRSASANQWCHPRSAQTRGAAVERGRRGVYPRPMADEPLPSARQPPQAPASGPADAKPEGERYGPLIVTRHRKDDGRALILYSLDRQA